MSTGSWMYSLTPQIHYVESHGHGGGSSASMNVNVHVPSTQPPAALAPGVPVHLTLNGRNASSPAENPNIVNSSTRSHSPGHGSSYTYQTPPSSALLNGNGSIYAGGEVSTSGTRSSFHDTDATSNSSPLSISHSQHEASSLFAAPRGALCPPASSIPLEHYVDRPHHDVQLLHCSQCTQRFASQDHFM